MKKNKNFKFFDDLMLSENFKQKLLNQTINNRNFGDEKRKINLSKLVCGIGIFVIFLFLSCTVVLATQYIKSYIFNIKKDENGVYHQTITVKEPAVIKDVINFNCSQGMKIKDIEDILNIKFINNFKYNDTIDSCKFQTNKEKKLESVSFDIYEYVDFSYENNKIDGYDSNVNNPKGYLKGKHISLNVSFMTANATDEVKKHFSNLNEIETSEEMKVKEIKLKNLNVLGYTYTPIRSNSSRFFTYVTFVYDNIVYTFTGYRVSIEDIINYIDSTKEDKIIEVEYNGNIEKITDNKDIEKIESILNNLKYEDDLCRGVVTHKIKLNDEVYYLKKDCKSLQKDDKQTTLNDEELETIINIINHYK